MEVVQSNGSSINYLKDKNHVYLDSYMNQFTVLDGANPASFEILDVERGFAHSGGNDYIFDSKIPFVLADAIELSSFYQRIHDEIYFDYQKPLRNVDIDSFKIFHADMNFAHDKDHFYFRDKVVPEIDIHTFHFLSACFDEKYYQGQDHTWYAVDAKNAYFLNMTAEKIKVIKVKNPENFKFEVIEEEGYGVYGDTRYYFGKKIKN